MAARGGDLWLDTLSTYGIGDVPLRMTAEEARKRAGKEQTITWRTYEAPLHLAQADSDLVSGHFEAKESYETKQDLERRLNMHARKLGVLPGSAGVMDPNASAKDFVYGDYKLTRLKNKYAEKARRPGLTEEQKDRYLAQSYRYNLMRKAVRKNALQGGQGDRNKSPWLRFLQNDHGSEFFLDAGELFDPQGRRFLRNLQPPEPNIASTQVDIDFLKPDPLALSEAKKIREKNYDERATNSLFTYLGAEPVRTRKRKQDDLYPEVPNFNLLYNLHRADPNRRQTIGGANALPAYISDIVEAVAGRQSAPGNYIQQLSESSAAPREKKKKVRKKGEGDPGADSEAEEDLSLVTKRKKRI